MTREEAIATLENSEYHDIKSDEVVLDGWFNVEELKAIIWLIEHNERKTG